MWSNYGSIKRLSLTLGRPLTRFFLVSLDNKSTFACLSLLCHNQWILSFLSLLAIKHWLKFDMLLRSITYTFSCLFLIKIMLLSFGLVITHIMVLKDIVYPLSHNWLIIIRLCFKPFICRTLSIKIVELIWILPMLTILPWPLSPNVTTPPSSLGLMMIN